MYSCTGWNIFIGIHNDRDSMQMDGSVQKPKWRGH